MNKDRKESGLTNSSKMTLINMLFSKEKLPTFVQSCQKRQGEGIAFRISVTTQQKTTKRESNN